MHVNRLFSVLCLFITLAALFLFPHPAVAQAHELGFSVGGQFPINTITTSLNPGFAIEGSYAGRLLNLSVASLYWELPVAYGFKNTGTFVSLSGVEQRQYSSLFVTPGLRLKLAPAFPISPFAALGVGVAHFNLQATTVSPQQSTNTTVLQIGGGLDMKVAPFISLRGEVRDFYSGNPEKSFLSSVPVVGTVAGRQHNILPMVGLVLRF